MPESHILKYHKYVSAFTKEFGLDYTSLEEDYVGKAISVGVYPDVSYLLYKIVESYIVNNIVEIGSGMSTCVISTAIDRTEKEFTTIESSTDWAVLVREVLEKRNIRIPNIVCTYEMRSPPLLRDNVDFMFIDGCVMINDHGTIDRIDSCLHYSYILPNAVIAFDDAQSFPHEISRWLNLFPDSENRKGIWYNPQQRDDRQIYISIPHSKLGIEQIINECVAVASKEV